MLYRLPVLFSADRPYQEFHYIRLIPLLLFHRKRRTIYQCAIYKEELIAHLQSNQFHDSSLGQSNSSKPDYTGQPNTLYRQGSEYLCHQSQMAKKNHRTELSGNFQRYRCRRPIPYPKPNLEQTVFPPLAEAENPQGTQPNPYFVPLGAYQEIQKDGNVKTNIPTNVPTFPLCRQYMLSKTSEYQSTGKHPKKVPRKKLLKYNR